VGGCSQTRCSKKHVAIGLCIFALSPLWGSVVPKPVAAAIPVTVHKPGAHSPVSGGSAATTRRQPVSELLKRHDGAHRLTADERAWLLELLDGYDATEPNAWRPLTDYWLSLHPPEHGSYAFLRIRGSEHHAIREMRRVVLTTEWGRA
jgi:hypothetical protein